MFLLQPSLSVVATRRLMGTPWHVSCHAVIFAQGTVLCVCMQSRQQIDQALDLCLHQNEAAPQPTPHHPTEFHSNPSSNWSLTNHISDIFAWSTCFIFSQEPHSDTWTLILHIHHTAQHNAQSSDMSGDSLKWLGSFSASPLLSGLVGVDTHRINTLSPTQDGVSRSIH